MTKGSAVLKNVLPERVHAFIDGALAGSANSAHDLILTAPSQLRPLIIDVLWQAGVPVTVLRTALSIAWEKDYKFMQTYFKGSALRSLFEFAGNVPPNLPSRIIVYRGGRWHASKLCHGISWTTNRAVACWFATQRFTTERLNGVPVVMRADVARKRVFQTSNKRREHEIIIFGGVRTAKVDGTLEDWRATAKKHVFS